MLQIAERSIRRIYVVDDDASARQSYSDPIEEMDVHPILVDGPLRSLEQFVSTMVASSDAALFDHHLGQRNYAVFNGASAVAESYKKRFPAVLCTAWEKSNIDELRPLRRYIPVVLRPRDVNPESLHSALLLCVREIDGVFEMSRRARRTLIRVEEIDEINAYFVVPGWRPDEVVNFPLKSLPHDVSEWLPKRPRFHAHVNTDASASEDLYFERWEP